MRNASLARPATFHQRFPVTPPPSLCGLHWRPQDDSLCVPLPTKSFTRSSKFSRKRSPGIDSTPRAEGWLRICTGRVCEEAMDPEDRGQPCQTGGSSFLRRMLHSWENGPDRGSLEVVERQHKDAISDRDSVATNDPLNSLRHLQIWRAEWHAHSLNPASCNATILRMLQKDPQPDLSRPAIERSKDRIATGLVREPTESYGTG